MEELEARRGNLAVRIWRQVAFLGRYAHQPVDVSLALTADDLMSLVAATAKLLEEEKQPND